MSVLEQNLHSPHLSHSAAHHLLATGELIDQCGYARVSDISRRLGITRGSVSVAMQSVKGSGLVDQDENHFFHLTELGQQTVASLRARHAVVEEFLTEVLGLTHEQSHRESCKMEYLLEAPTVRRLAGLLEFWREHPAQEQLEAHMNASCPLCNRQGDASDCPCCNLERTTAETQETDLS